MREFFVKDVLESDRYIFIFVLFFFAKKKEGRKVKKLLILNKHKLDYIQQKTTTKLAIPK